MPPVSHASSSPTLAATAANAHLASHIGLVATKAPQYKADITTNHENCIALAHHLNPDDDPDEAHGVLMGLTKNGHDGAAAAAAAVYQPDEIAAFLQTQRERLLKVAERNVHNERQVDIFCQALTVLRNQVATSSNETTTTTTTTANFDAVLAEYMNMATTQMAESQLAMQHEDKVRAVMKELGMQVAAVAAAAGTNDDDDIEVMNGGGTQNAGSLTCPITCALMVQPVRSKVCHHTYSAAGIASLFKTHGVCKCPVAGCTNTHVTPTQLVPDKHMEKMVKREERRQAARAEQMLSQADAVDDDESDEEEF